MKQLTHLFKAVQSIRTWLFVLMVGLAGHASAAVTSLRFNSEPGEPLLGGQQFFFTPSNGTFSAGHSLSNSVSISFNSSDHNFSLQFAAPQNARLTAGSYVGAERYPFQGVGKPGMSIFGDGVGCNTLTGSFEVKQVSYGSGSQLNKFWATFEQHCEDALEALRGEIRFNADVPVVVNAPGSVIVAEGGLLSFVVSAIDLQNRRVTLTASNVPPGANFVDNGNSTGTFMWTPGAGAAGVYSVNFHGENGLGASDDASTSIEVTILGDDIGNARPIIALPYTSTLDTTAATTASDDPYSCTYPRHTVWYAFTATNRVRLRASTSGSDYATVLSVFTGARGSLLAVGCMEDFGSLQPEVVFDTVAGRTYYFMVGTGESSQEGGNLVFSVNALVPPPNDEITSATTISALPYTHVLETTGAITANDDPNYCGYHGHTVWYSFTPTVPLRIEANTAGSDYETALSVFTGTRGALNLVVCDDGDDDRPFSVATFNAAAGRRYYFMIAGTGGRLTLSVTPVLPPPNDDFDRATVITGLPYTDVLNTSLATTNVDDPTSCNQLGATVWYSFTPTQDLFVEGDARASDYSVVLPVYTGSRGALEQVACFGGAEVRLPRLCRNDILHYGRLILWGRGRAFGIDASWPAQAQNRGQY
jgi:putative Ig domain-containing protein